jgi:hypothetical protein
VNGRGGPPARGVASFDVRLVRVSNAYSGTLAVLAALVWIGGAPLVAFDRRGSAIANSLVKAAMERTRPSTANLATQRMASRFPPARARHLNTRGTYVRRTEQGRGTASRPALIGSGQR